MDIRRAGFVSRTYRHLPRYRQILTILFKYGFGDLLDRLKVGEFLRIGLRMFSRTQRQRIAKLTRSERLRIAFEELGPTFIKLAQILSTRPDLIPLEFTQELSKLQDQVPPFPFPQVREIVEAELKGRLEEIFSEFEETPIAAASIGQVHRARLATGEEVAVKVQRPRIQKTVEVDLEILFHLALLIERYVAEWRIHRPTRVVQEFAHTMEREMDYTTEAAHAERFARQFADHPEIRVPRVYRPFSTSRVLTLEYLRGIKVSELAVLDAAGHDRKVIASRGADLILEQVFVHGFFHADPHPGNVFILPGDVIAYLDFGMMGSVDRQAREDFAQMVFGYIRREPARIAETLLKMAEWDVEPNRRALERDISEFIGLYSHPTLGELQIARLLKETLAIILRHGLRFPPDLFLMIKAVATAEGIGAQLDPDFDMIPKAAPYVRRILVERLHPRRLFREFMASGGDLVQFLQEIPGDMRDIFRQVRQGKVRIGFEHRGLEDFFDQLDRSFSRVSFSLIISSLIIGSSIVLRTDVGPYLFGFPFLGLLGFGIAAILGLGLIISMLRSGRW